MRRIFFTHKDVRLIPTNSKLKCELYLKGNPTLLDIEEFRNIRDYNQMLRYAKKLQMWFFLLWDSLNSFCCRPHERHQGTRGHRDRENLRLIVKMMRTLATQAECGCRLLRHLSAPSMNLPLPVKRQKHRFTFPRMDKAFLERQEKLRIADNVPEGAELIFLLPKDRWAHLRWFRMYTWL